MYLMGLPLGHVLSYWRTVYHHCQRLVVRLACDVCEEVFELAVDG